MTLPVYSDGDITDRPEANAGKYINKPMISNFSIQSDINLAAIRQELEKSIQGTIATFRGGSGGCVKKKILFAKVSIGCNWWGEVRKTGAIRLTGNGEVLSFQMPVHAWIRAKTRKLGIRETAEMDVTVMATARPKITRDWKLELNLDSDFRWDRRAEMRLFGLIKVSLGTVAGKEIRKQLAKLNKKAEESVQKINIKEKAAESWKKLFLPFKISSNPSIWIRPEPKSVGFSGISITNDIMHMTAGVKASVDTFVGNEPEAIAPAPLPQLALSVEKPGTFTAKLPIFVSYKALEAELEKVMKLNKQTAPIPDSPDILVTLKDIEIYPSNGRIAVGVRFSADLPDKRFDTSGKVYLVGKPVIDNKSRIFKVKEFNFTETTDNDLVNVIVTVLRPAIRDRIQAKLIYGYSSDYNSLMKQAKAALTKELGNGLRTEGMLNDISVGSFFLLKDQIQINLIGHGNFAILYGL